MSARVLAAVEALAVDLYGRGAAVSIDANRQRRDRGGSAKATVWLANGQAAMVVLADTKTDALRDVRARLETLKTEKIGTYRKAAADGR